MLPILRLHPSAISTRYHPQHPRLPPCSWDYQAKSAPPSRQYPPHSPSICTTHLPLGRTDLTPRSSLRVWHLALELFVPSSVELSCHRGELANRPLSERPRQLRARRGTYFDPCGAVLQRYRQRDLWIGGGTNARRGSYRTESGPSSALHCCRWTSGTYSQRVLSSFPWESRSLPCLC